MAGVAFMCDFPPSPGMLNISHDHDIPAPFPYQPGQSLWLAGQHPLPEHPVPMHYVDHESWEVTIPLTPRPRKLPGTTPTFCVRPMGRRPPIWAGIIRPLPSVWMATTCWSWIRELRGFVENVFYTEPFKKVLLAGISPRSHPLHRETHHTFASRLRSWPKIRPFACSAAPDPGALEHACTHFAEPEGEGGGFLRRVGFSRAAVSG